MSNTNRTRILFVPAELIVAKIRPSVNTLHRLKRALELWETRDYDYVVVSGGKFLSPVVQTEPAAQIMADWLFHYGVQADRVIIENQSLDTFENIKLSVKAIAERCGTDRSTWEITVVTQWQHMERFAVSFKSIFGITIKLVPLNYPMPFFGKLMEYVMIIYHYYDAHGVGMVARSNRDKRRQAALGL